MKMEKSTKVSTKIACLGLSGVMAFMMCDPMLALATDGSDPSDETTSTEISASDNDDTTKPSAEKNSTKMTLQYIEDAKENSGDYGDNEDKILEGDNLIIHYSVPSTLPMAFKSDGTIICASGESYAIVNESISNVYLGNVVINPGDDYTINGIKGAGEEENKIADISLKFNTKGKYDAADAVYYAPTKTDNLDDIVIPKEASVQLGFGGNINGTIVVDKFLNAQKVGSLTWTVNPKPATTDTPSSSQPSDPE